VRRADPRCQLHQQRSCKPADGQTAPAHDLCTGRQPDMKRQDLETQNWWQSETDCARARKTAPGIFAFRERPAAPSGTSTLTQLRKSYTHFYIHA
jgi:hypothetical protein